MLDYLPVLETERLRLCPFTLNDAPRVSELAGAFEVASTTLLIPHPYPDGAAEAWIATHGEQARNGEIYTFAITRRENGLLVGAISLGVNRDHNRAEMGYWLGVPFWGQGIMTEAARRLIAFGFNDLKLNRVFATYLTRNPASGRVMQKAGMTYEGTARQAVRKWDVYEDLGMYGIVRADVV